jgi:hypothetical protein
MKKLFTFALALFLASGVLTDAQSTVKVSGLVKGFKTIPLNNVKITAEKSGLKAISGANGEFSIECSAKDVLTFTASGFKSKKLRTEGESMLDVEMIYILKPKSFEEATLANHLNAEVLQKAIAAEEQKRAKDYSKYSSIWELIDSEIYEVRVTGNTVYNNKVKSMNSNPQVLYVVDDKIVSDISYINPTYVKSIEFVEDVGSTMYGSKGANGVLKISLK